jgi:hypothetical protein
VAERHAIEERPDLPIEERCRLLEIRLAQLWDQVWWLSLTPECREAFRKDGFRDPVMTAEEHDKARAAGVDGHIQRFYEER